MQLYLLLLALKLEILHEYDVLLEYVPEQFQREVLMAGLPPLIEELVPPLLQRYHLGVGIVEQRFEFTHLRIALIDLLTQQLHLHAAVGGGAARLLVGSDGLALLGAEDHGHGLHLLLKLVDALLDFDLLDEVRCQLLLRLVQLLRVRQG